MKHVERNRWYKNQTHKLVRHLGLFPHKESVTVWIKRYQRLILTSSFFCFCGWENQRNICLAGHVNQSIFFIQLIRLHCSVNTKRILLKWRFFIWCFKICKKQLNKVKNTQPINIVFYACSFWITHTHTSKSYQFSLLMKMKWDMNVFSPHSMTHLTPVSH